MKKMITRRRFLFGLSCLGMAAATGAYTRFMEPSWLRVVHRTIQLGPEPAEPIRIVQISDMHASRKVPLDHISEAISLAVDAKPDLVCATGDFITVRDFDAGRYAEVLRPLAQAAPTYACLGNHDGGEWVHEHCGGFPGFDEVLELLAAARMDCLRNASRRIEVRGRAFTLVGAGDVLAPDADPDRAFAGVPDDGTPTVLMSHNPDSKGLFRRKSWDLMLCGHTHGGQVSIPFLGPPYTGLGDRRYVAGLKTWEGRLLHITRGVGNLRGIRFNCRPEVSVLTLT